MALGPGLGRPTPSPRVARGGVPCRGSASGVGAGLRTKRWDGAMCCYARGGAPARASALNGDRQPPLASVMCTEPSTRRCCVLEETPLSVRGFAGKGESTARNRHYSPCSRQDLFCSHYHHDCSHHWDHHHNSTHSQDLLAI